MSAIKKTRHAVGPTILVTLTISAWLLAGVGPTLEPRVYFPVVGNQYPMTKRGLAYATAMGDCEDVIGTGIDWYYTWWPKPILCGVEAVPQFSTLQAWEWLGDKEIGGESPWIMWLNEPDLWDQANIAPCDETVLEYYRQFEERFGRIYKIVSASTFISPSWLGRQRDCYFDSYGEYPRWKAIGAHLYHSPCGIEDTRDFQAMLDVYVDMAEEWDVEVWITEMSTDSVEELRAVLDRAAVEPRITRVAWFTIRSDGRWDHMVCIEPLLDGDELTDIGSAYIR